MTMVAHYSDDEARRLIAEALDETLIVEAAAGTGKTTELINRIIRVVAEGRAQMREIVAVTFTEKAAGELELRLRQRLEEERQRSPDLQVAARLAAAVQSLEEAHVSTIHGFCADLLRQRPVEAGVDPLFRVLTEGQAERLFTRAFDGWLQAQLEHPPEGIRRSLRRTSRAFASGDVDQDGPVERLCRAAADLAEWRDFRGAWRRDPFDRRASIVRLVHLVHACADISAAPSFAGDNLYVDMAPLRRLSRDLRTRGDSGLSAGLGTRASGLDTDTRQASIGGAAEHELDGLEAQLIDLGRNRDFKRARKGSGAAYGKGVTRADVLAARDAVIEALAEFQVKADADLAAALHGELLGCIDEYERLKVREGAMDFLDLLLRARDLVRHNAAVRREFQQEFRRIFIDEFQDTDPLQAELLLLLASDDPVEDDWRRVTPVPGKLFIVGDPKQSIYRFRRADVGIYLEVCRRLTAAGARAIQLRKSFRAVRNIQGVVNLAFRPVMDGRTDSLQAEYVPLERSRADQAGQPSVIALPVPRPYAQRYIAAGRIAESLPDAVGAFIEWLLTRSGWTVTERHNPGVRVPVDARHICILFRRFLSYGSDVTRPYVDALEARGVRHLLVGGRTFYDREEIETLRAALMAVEWPDDQLSVFATLRGPLFAIGDEELLEYFQHSRAFHPFRRADGLPVHLEPVREALAALAMLHRERNRRPVADTIFALLEHTRAHVGFVLRPGGEQALANVLHVAELARQYELDGGMSFRGFVETLRAEALSQQPAEAPILEEGSDGVRLMTVHKAKGLEFPVVVLADITARLTPYDAARHLDARAHVCAQRIGGWSPADLNDHRSLEMERERAEGERVAYVAATRARDLLVVPAVGDEPYAEGWVSPLNTALYPAEGGRRRYVPAPGCPLFKTRDSVLNRPDGDPALPLTVCPGAHRTGVDEYGEDVSVAWWAPDALALGAEAAFGLRREDLIVRDVSPDVLRAQLDTYEAWRNGRANALQNGRVPSIRVSTATEWAATHGSPREQPLDAIVPSGSAIDDIAVAMETVEVRPARPSGARFGALVHAVLADMPLEPDGSALALLAEAHGRIHGATTDEIDAARTVAQQVLIHPVMRAAADALAHGVCYRETPVTWRLEDGSVIEGNVDLAYIAGDDLVVVDFKTDREIDEALGKYRRQVQIYAAAAAHALGRRARAVLMRV